MTPPVDDGGMRPVGQALSLGAELVTPALIGWWLDQQFGWSPRGLLTGGVLGFVLVVMHALRLTRNDAKDDASNKTDEPKNDQGSEE